MFKINNQVYIALLIPFDSELFQKRQVKEHRMEPIDGKLLYITAIDSNQDKFY